MIKLVLPIAMILLSVLGGCGSPPVVLHPIAPDHIFSIPKGTTIGDITTERDGWYAGVLPDTITIFRNPILRICETSEDVVDEVRVTVVHEVAHHFGIDDDTLHDLGWG